MEINHNTSIYLKGINKHDELRALATYRSKCPCYCSSLEPHRIYHIDIKLKKPKNINSHNLHYGVLEANLKYMP